MIGSISDRMWREVVGCLAIEVACHQEHEGSHAGRARHLGRLTERGCQGVVREAVPPTAWAGAHGPEKQPPQRQPHPREPEWMRRTAARLQEHRRAADEEAEYRRLGMSPSPQPAGPPFTASSGSGAASSSSAGPVRLRASYDPLVLAASAQHSAVHELARLRLSGGMASTFAAGRHAVMICGRPAVVHST